MRFVYQDVALNYDPDQGYEHPQSGESLELPLMCLKGWLEKDAEKRQRWVTLVAFIEDYWIRQDRLDSNETSGDEIVFS